MLDDERAAAAVAAVAAAVVCVVNDAACEGSRVTALTLLPPAHS